MRRISLLACLLVIPKLLLAVCDPTTGPTYTSNMGLAKPVLNACGWGTTTNNNWSIVDSSVAILSGTNGFTGANSFSSNPVAIKNQSLQFYDASLGRYIGLQAAGTVTTTNFTLPTADGSSGQVIKTDGSGNLSFVSQSGGGGSSPLAVGTGTLTQFTNQVSSPTSILSFNGTQFTSVLSAGTTNFIGVNLSSITAVGNSFNQASQLVKLDASSKLPAVDGSQLTGLIFSGGLIPGSSNYWNSPSTATFTDNYGIVTTSITATTVTISGLASGQCVQTGIGGILSVTGNQCNPPSAFSTLGTYTGTLALSQILVTSPTVALNFNSSQFTDTLTGGNTAYIALNPGTTLFIQNSATLQSGATFYISSGTVDTNLYVGSITVRGIPSSGTNPKKWYVPFVDNTNLLTWDSRLSYSPSLKQLTVGGNPESSFVTNGESLNVIGNGGLETISVSNSNSGFAAYENFKGASHAAYFGISGAAFPSAFSVANDLFLGVDGGQSIDMSSAGTLKLASFGDSTGAVFYEAHGSSTTYGVYAGSMTVGNGITILAGNSSSYEISSSSSSSPTNFFHVMVSTSGHFITGGPAPTVTSCGTGSPSVSGNDNEGTITVGGTAPTACTLIFANTWGTTPICTITDNSLTISDDISSLSNTQMVLGFGVGGLAGGTVYYRCGCSGSSCR